MLARFHVPETPDVIMGGPLLDLTCACTSAGLALLSRDQLDLELSPWATWSGAVQHALRSALPLALCPHAFPKWLCQLLGTGGGSGNWRPLSKSASCHSFSTLGVDAVLCQLQVD